MAVSQQVLFFRHRDGEHTEHDQRQDAKVKLQHVRLLVPWLAIFGEYGKQFAANSSFGCCFAIVSHVAEAESEVASAEENDD